MDDKIIMDPQDILNLMIVGRDWYYERLIEVQEDLKTLENNPDIKFNKVNVLLVIEREHCYDHIENATKTIDAFKKAHNLY